MVGSYTTIQLDVSVISVSDWLGTIVPVVEPSTVCADVVAKLMLPVDEFLMMYGLIGAVVALGNVAIFPGAVIFTTSSLLWIV